MYNKTLVELIRKAQSADELVKIMDNYGITTDNKKIAQIEFTKQTKINALEEIRIAADGLNTQIHYLANEDIDNTNLFEILRNLLNEISRLSNEIDTGA